MDKKNTKIWGSRVIKGAETNVIIERSYREPVSDTFSKLLKNIMARGIGIKQFYMDDKRKWTDELISEKVGVKISDVISWKEGFTLPTSENMTELFKIFKEDSEIGRSLAGRLQFCWARESDIERDYSINNIHIGGDLIIEPEQTQKAITFEVKDGKIEFSPDFPDKNFVFNSDLIDDYKELKRECENLVKNCPVHSNMYETLRQALNTYYDALGENIQDIRRSDLWRAGRTLRRLRSADQRRVIAGDSEDVPYDPEQGSSLEALVVLHNTFSSMEPKLSELDRRGSDPAEVPTKHAVDIARKVAIDIDSKPNIIQKDIPKALISLLDEGTEESLTAPRAATIGVDSTKNITVVILNAAVREVRECISKNSETKPQKVEAISEVKKGIYGEAGKMIVNYGSLSFASVVLYYRDDIIALARHLPSGELLKDIIEWIIKFAT